MFDGRHCVKKDLDLLIDETLKIERCVLESIDYINELKQYINFIKRFDIDIADKIDRDIKYVSDDREKIIKIIDKNIDMLKQNVLVDIYEHK